MRLSDLIDTMSRTHAVVARPLPHGDWAYIVWAAPCATIRR